MVTTTIDDVETTESFGAWKNINSCTYFARALSLQNRLPHEKYKPDSLKSKLYNLPVNAYFILALILVITTITIIVMERF